MVRKYRQPAMVEEFISGREFTVALLGETRPKVLPPMEIVFTNTDDKFPVYSFAHKIDTKGEVRYQAPADIDPTLKKKIQDAARKAFMALGCRDVARIDFRLDSQGEVRFIECNPLPGLTPGWSDLCLIAEAAGIGYADLIQEILSPAIRRLKELRRELLQNQEAKPHAQQLEDTP
jgi:D-alanine-D-alanine ligase